LLVLDRILGSEAEDLLDRLAVHPALGGRALEEFKAQLARQRRKVGSYR
jgi:hypothetical protein